MQNWALKRTKTNFWASKESRIVKSYTRCNASRSVEIKNWKRIIS